MRIYLPCFLFSLSLSFLFAFPLSAQSTNNWEFSGSGVLSDCSIDGHIYTGYSVSEPEFVSITHPNGCPATGIAFDGILSSGNNFFPGSLTKKYIGTAPPITSSEWTMAPEMWAFFYASLKFVAMHWVLLTITRWL